MLNFSFFFKKKCAFPAFSENSISKYNNNFINNNNLENVRKMQELRQKEKCAFLILSQQGEEEEKKIMKISPHRILTTKKMMAELVISRSRILEVPKAPRHSQPAVTWNK